MRPWRIDLVVVVLNDHIYIYTYVKQSSYVPVIHVIKIELPLIEMGGVR